MNKENLERICEQISSMEDAFDTLRDNCYWIRKAIESKIKQAGAKE